MMKKRKKILCITFIVLFISIALYIVALSIRNYIREKKMMEVYQGMKVTWYGDSLTQMYFYCGEVDRYFGFDGQNSGVNGSLITMINGSSLCAPTRMNCGDEEDIAPDSAIIFIMAGVNDWIYSMPMGDVEKTFNDTQKGILTNDTFAGACNQMFYYLKEHYPNAQIIVLGTPPADGTYAKLFDGAGSMYNKLGLTSVEYGDTLCEVAQMWGIDNINIGRKLDWNSDNIMEYCVDGIHFNQDKGSVEVAKEIIKFMKKMNGVI